MNLKHLFQVGFLALFCFLIVPVFGQNKLVSGKVTDHNDGAPLSGVSIVVKGSSKGINTAADGTFKIMAPISGTLVFTYVDYLKKRSSCCFRIFIGTT
jgi:hypothetical protein